MIDPMEQLKNIQNNMNEDKTDRDENRNITANETIEYLHCLKKRK